MKTTNAVRRTSAALCCISLLGLAACASGPATRDPVPPALEPDTPVRVLATVAATGVQIYECRATPGATAPGWAFVAPDAELFDAQGRSVGSHGAGPVWASPDGSRVVGSVRYRADYRFFAAARAPDAAALLQRLLTARLS